jgi:hypothetical protein
MTTGGHNESIQNVSGQNDSFWALLIRLAEKAEIGRPRCAPYHFPIVNVSRTLSHFASKGGCPAREAKMNFFSDSCRKRLKLHRDGWIDGKNLFPGSFELCGGNALGRSAE